MLAATNHARDTTWDEKRIVPYFSVRFVFKVFLFLILLNNISREHSLFYIQGVFPSVSFRFVFEVFHVQSPSITPRGTISFFAYKGCSLLLPFALFKVLYV